jgi:hypothetical protein
VYSLESLNVDFILTAAINLGPQVHANVLLY